MATLTYEYKVRDRAGAMKTGTLEAESASSWCAPPMGTDGSWRPRCWSPLPPSAT